MVVYCLVNGAWAQVERTPARLVRMLVIFGHAFAFVSQMMSNFGTQPSLTASMWDQPPARTYASDDPFKYAWGYVMHTPSPD